MIDVQELRQLTDTFNVSIRGIEEHLKHDKINPQFVINILCKLHSDYELLTQEYEKSTRSTDQSITSADY